MNTILISIVLVISTSVLNTTFQLRDKLITIDIANKNKAINESMIYEGVNDNPYIGFMFTDIDQNLMSYLQSLGITDSMGF